MSLRGRSVLALLSCGALLVGCTPEATAPTPSDPPSTPATPDPACEVPLVVTQSSDGPIRLYAEVSVDGEPGFFLVDTGANVSFVSTPDLPDGTPDVATVELGCESFSALGRPFDASAENGSAGGPILGFLGSDWFLQQPTRIDTVAAVIQRLPEAPELGHPLQVQNVFDFLFVQATIDGTALLLGFDTGAPHALWIGVDGRPSDLPYETQDGFGDPITLWQGTGALDVGDGTREVPVLRVLHHPSIEASDEQLGIDADGLLGLTSWPSGSAVIDGATIWLE